MKTLYILFVGLLVSGSVMAQSCLPDGITFTTQSQIDSFQIIYPNCTEIEGNVTIREDVVSLNGLNVLTSIGGGLSIKYTSDLTNLSGLDNVTFIGGYLDIIVNDDLTSFSGLDNVTSIGGGFEIAYNNALTSLSHLEDLTSIEGYLIIKGNDVLTSLSGLENVTSVGGLLEIYSNASLSSLSGLDNVTFTEENLHIYHNQLLSDCAILNICTYLENSTSIIYIHNNATGCNSSEEVQDSCIANGVNIDEQIIADKIIIFPNPSSTQITVELPATPQKNTSLTIYNLNGQQFITQRITEPQTVVDVTGLPKGVYFVKVQDDEKVMMGKVIKE